METTGQARRLHGAAFEPRPLLAYAVIVISDSSASQSHAGRGALVLDAIDKNFDGSTVPALRDGQHHHPCPASL